MSISIMSLNTEMYIYMNFYVYANLWLVIAFLMPLYIINLFLLSFYCLCVYIALMYILPLCIYCLCIYCLCVYIAFLFILFYSFLLLLPIFIDIWMHTFKSLCLITYKVNRVVIYSYIFLPLLCLEEWLFLI